MELAQTSPRQRTIGGEVKGAGLGLRLREWGLLFARTLPLQAPSTSSSGTCWSQSPLGVIPSRCRGAGPSKGGSYLGRRRYVGFGLGQGIQTPKTHCLLSAVSVQPTSRANAHACSPSHTVGALPTFSQTQAKPRATGFERMVPSKSSPGPWPLREQVRALDSVLFK